MKTIFFSLLFMLPACLATAQETATEPAAGSKTYNRELGIFGQTEGGNDGTMGLVGLQYKHWRDEHFGFRAIAAFGQHISHRSTLQYAQDDTSFVRQQQFRINMPVIGFGLEAQRHFYKKIYLFAAVELKGGYGSGTVDTVLTRQTGIINQGPPSIQSFGRRDASLLYVGLTASIGAKVQFNRVCAGLELYPAHMNYNWLDDSRNRSAITDFSMGNFSQRFFLHLRL